MEIFVPALLCLMFSFGKTVTAQATPVPLSGICKSEVREVRPKWGPYAESYTDYYRAPCPPPRFGICVFSKISYRHTVGLQHEVVYRDSGKCCEGYKQTAVNPLKCEPICTAGCTNGYCKRPDECECNEGYEHATKYTCKPVCTAGCGNNSVCTAPDTCVCAPGYESNKNASDECVPKCTAACVNSDCTAPNTCTCYKGYQTTSVPNVCMPVCTKKCVNGVCIAPDKCMCLPHYAPNTTAANWYACVPSACADCRNGYCTEDKVCQCNANYTKDPVDGECKPVCSRACVNGKCWKPEKCLCNIGYVWDEYNPFLCNPQCRERCENGWCSAPDHCSCFDDYRKSENNSYVCESICEQLCQNGSCENNACICNEGFVLQNGDKYKCTVQNERVAEITEEEEEKAVTDGGGIENKSPCIFSVRDAIKTESASGCVLFNENMVMKTKYVCRYLNRLTKNVCINRFCEKNNSTSKFCKSFLNCYVITEYVKSIDRNKYTFDCNLSANVTQYDYVVDLNDTDVSRSNFSDWFSVDMKVDWFDFNSGKVKPFVVVDDTENTDESCEWCLCPVDLRPKCDGTPFQLHVCSCPRKSASSYRPAHISTMYIMLAILGGLSIFLGVVAVSVLTGNYLWRRHREKNDPLKYKVQAVSCKFDSSRNNTVRELISDDEDSDENGGGITLRFEGFR